MDAKQTSSEQVSPTQVEKASQSETVLDSVESRETKPEQTDMKSSTASLEAELTMLRDVYSALRSEIRADEGKLNENLNLTIAGIGAVVAIIGFVANLNQFALILALPSVFFVLMLIRLGTLLGLGRIGSYLSKAVYPRMRAIINELDHGQHDFGEFSIDWEEFHPKLSPPALISTSITASPSGLQLLFSLFPLLAHFYYKTSASQPFSNLEIGLIILNLVAFVFISLLFIWSYFFGKKIRRIYRQ